MDDIIISKHAVERFCERKKYIREQLSKDPEATIRKLLKKAEPENIDSHQKVKRLLNNNFQEATYLVASGWRFVVVDGVLKTCERTKNGQN